MKKVFGNCYLVLLLIAFWPKPSAASHPADSILKYNEDFAGVGPQVYILPPPKSDEELLQDRYIDKKNGQMELVKLINQHELLKSLKFVDNGLMPKNANLAAENDREKQAEAAINFYVQQNRIDSAMAWKNRLACMALMKDDKTAARALFTEVYAYYGQTGDQEKGRALLLNRAVLEERSDNYVKALAYYDDLLKQARKAKNLQDEGLLNLSVATIESKLGNFSAAHNLVIKKSFPLLQKAKYYPDVVNALNILAAIKESEDKPTEAKWIYLQAIDVASTHRDERGLARSLYNVAELKNRIGDGELSIADYKLAKEYASKHNMHSLLVEIEDGLGDAYLQSGNYAEAAMALNSYNILKGEFISKQFL